MPTVAFVTTLPLNGAPLRHLRLLGEPSAAVAARVAAAREQQGARFAGGRRGGAENPVNAVLSPRGSRTALDARGEAGGSKDRGEREAVTRRA